MTHLTRAMRLPDATAMVVGTIIGASIFVQPSEITRAVPFPTGVALVWGLAGILTLIGALVCAELSSTLPRTGGVYAFLRDLFGRPVAFLWGWAMFWSMHSGIIAAIAVVFARYVGYFVPLGTVGVRATAVGVIVALSAFNCLGVWYGSRLQTVVTAAKLGAIALLVGAGLLLAPARGATPSADLSGIIVEPTAIIMGLIAGLFAFGGWHMVTYTAEETIQPERTIPRSLMLGVAIVTICYVALNVIYLSVLPIDQVTSSTRIAADAAQALVGPTGGGLVAALVVLSTFGALNGIVLAGPRVYFAMANDGLLFRWVAALHPKTVAPVRAILLQALWASVGTHRHVPWHLHACRLYRVDLLRTTCRGSSDVAASRRLPASISDARGDRVGDRIRDRVRRDPDQPDRDRSTEQPDRPSRRCRRITRVLSCLPCRGAAPIYCFLTRSRSRGFTPIVHDSALTAD